MGLFLSFWGIRRMLPILNPITFLIRQADITAIEWVRNNIAENETILINPFAWGYGLFAGYDGGYWISPLAGRKTYPPPILYGMDKDRNYALEIIDTCTQIVEQKDNIPNLVSLMSKNNINYVYLGARSGVISPRLMNESGFFNVIYQKEGVQIFQRK